MAKKYPMVKPWLEYHRVSDDEYVIENEIVPIEQDDVPLRLPAYAVNIAQKLDGNTNPYRIEPSIDSQTVRACLEFFSEQGYLRDRVRNLDLGRLAFPIVRYDGKPYYSKSAVFLNVLLSLLWGPVLLCGIILGLEVWSHHSVFADTYLFGLLFGLVVGMLLHESGHVIAAKAYKVPVYEVGIKISLMPVAYTIMNETATRSRFKKTHIYAAGVETNFFLAGLFLSIANLLPSEDICTFFFYAGLENMLLGITNMCFFLPLDGFKIIATLLGADDMARYVLIALFMPSLWIEQIKKGPSGLARMLAISLMQLMQTIVLIWLLINLAVVFYE